MDTSIKILKSNYEFGIKRNYFTDTAYFIFQNQYALSSNSFNGLNYQTFGKDLVIYCQYLTIDGVINNYGQNIFIYAREIMSLNSGELNVSGINHDLDIILPAMSGSTPGESGASGDASKAFAGGNGGYIVIFCDNIEGSLHLVSNGGNGSNGQNGGEGVVGKDGLNGADNLNCGYIGYGLGMGAPGQTGYGGGNGGNGGKGGNGGNGGFISLNFTDQKNLRISPHQ